MVTVIGWSVVSFAVGWVLGRALLRIWFHRELDKLQAKVLVHNEKLSANNQKILELTQELKAMVQASGGADERR